jgi:hypothetical protein
MTRIVITIDAPEGVEVHVTQSGHVPDDFEHEPLPPFAGTEEHFDDIVGQQPTPEPEQPPTPVRRGIAVAQPAPFAWQEGMKHDPSHKPIKSGNKGGWYCPTALGKGPDGRTVYCSWRAA